MDTYNRFQFIKEIAKGGFSTVYYAKWIGGPIHKIVGQISKNPEKRNIFGVLPYIAPEVLCREEYTKAADIYSSAIIIYEMIMRYWDA
ncbi:hypothetical protein Glove_283g158 [Diversispora epigaea]|uniref:Protein kinase domain-containing protein n=1 Tax=Diversispora epigaea TaxID=1348612 RepID=A0A397I8I6_9GLOM|nr:hypothetical protein Glove_283g158 [Diversispora epigaea]